MSEVEEEVEETAGNENNEPETEETELSTEEQEPVVEEESEEEGELVVSFGEDSPPQDSEGPKWFRRAIKDKEARLKRLEEENAKLKGSQPQETLGAKPTLEGCDYDSAVFERELEGWYEKKRAIDVNQSELKKRQEEEQQKFQEKVSAYETSKATLKVKPEVIEDAESLVKGLMDETQLGCLFQYADSPGKFIIGLGANPEKAETLSNIKDYGLFIKTIAQWEGKMKETRKRPATVPEKVITSTATNAGSLEAQIKKLEKSSKGNDRTEIIRLKKELRKRKKE